jgi:ferritin
MAMTKKMQEAISSQINRELYSAYLYLSMAAYFDSLNLLGFSNWMKVQVQEEKTHAMKFYDYVYKRGGKVIMGSIEAPPKEWQSALDAFVYTLEHEKKVTALINGLVKIAISTKDKETEYFLDWFLEEQEEEEESAEKVIKKLKKAGDPSLLDKEMSLRVYKHPEKKV